MRGGIVHPVCGPRRISNCCSPYVHSITRCASSMARSNSGVRPPAEAFSAVAIGLRGSVSREVWRPRRVRRFRVIVEHHQLPPPAPNVLFERRITES